MWDDSMIMRIVRDNNRRDRQPGDPDTCGSRSTNVVPCPGPRSPRARSRRAARRAAARGPARCRVRTAGRRRRGRAARRARTPTRARPHRSRRRVGDAELDRVAVRARGDADRALGGRVLARVGEQVLEHLREAHRVGRDPAPARSARRPASGPRASQAGRTASSAAWTAAATGTFSIASSMCPRVIRETSSRSSTSLRRMLDLALAISAAWRAGAPSFASIAITRTAVARPAIGLRSSWPSIARNSSLRRSASRSASIASRRSVTSRCVPITRRGRPASSRSTMRPRASNPDPVAVLAAQPVLALVERGAALEVRPHQRVRAIEIVRVHELAPGVDPRREVVRVVAEHRCPVAATEIAPVSTCQSQNPS